MPAKTKTSKATRKTKATKSTKATKATKKSVKKVEEKVEEKVVEKIETENKQNSEMSKNENNKVEEKKVEEVDPDQEWHNILKSMETSQKSVMESMRQQVKLRKELTTILNRRVKALKKRKNKRGGGNQKKNPSGFNKPTHISKELSTFLSVDEKTLMPRTDATKMIHKYIKEHKLQDAKDGRNINCDKSLQKLLKVPKDVTLSYFNLQTYLSPHFLKATTTVKSN